jgi:syntaxin 18
LIDLNFGYKMSRFRDRTEDFKDSVRNSAVSIGYNESKVASTMASFIIHKPKERSPFTKAAFKTVPLVIQHFYLKYVCCIIE